MYAGAEVDVWSCGVILFALLCARLPFDDDSMANLFLKIRCMLPSLVHNFITTPPPQQQPWCSRIFSAGIAGVFSIPEHVSPECKDIISQMLIVDPLKRITIAEIRYVCRCM
jgi:5'-AMP-activated protein kinase, catalytic alpha subunit